MIPLPKRGVAEKRRDREAEFVEQIGSFEAGIASVAAPIRDLSGRTIAAFNATTSADGSGGIPPQLRDAVVAAAHRISRLMGAEQSPSEYGL